MNLEKNYMEFIGPKVLDDFIVLYVFIFTDLMMDITTYHLIIDWNNNG